MMGFVLIIPLLLIGIIIYAFGWRPQSNQQQTREGQQSPLDVMKARYARGEISKHEYEEMRHDLIGLNSG